VTTVEGLGNDALVAIGRRGSWRELADRHFDTIYHTSGREGREGLEHINMARTTTQTIGSRACSHTEIDVLGHAERNLVETASSTLGIGRGPHATGNVANRARDKVG
jgi:hypothetical protein